MQIDIKNLKIELNRKVLRLSNYIKTKLRIENKEVRFTISTDKGIFTTEVDFDSKSYDQILDELVLKVQRIINKIEAERRNNF